mmetsp:Transcript_23089/g.60340  ORF Transcript_23089/g.60340 Transcript_23089/m.60340 type:complete len:401 (-) Transcript_23089:78-1280(-)
MSSLLGAVVAADAGDLGEHAASPNRVDPPAGAAAAAADGGPEPIVTVRVGTFNLKGTPPKTEGDELRDIHEWVGAEDDADICAFGFQEVDEDPQTLMFNLASPKVEEWCQAIEAHLPEGQYSRIATEQLVGIMIVVYVRDELCSRVTNIVAAVQPTGMMGFGNKGGVAVRFDLDETGFCFVCTHLAAHQGAVDKRNTDFREVMTGLKFWQEGEVAAALQVQRHERVIWMGDLNYRIDLERGPLMDLIADKNYRDLLKADQLSLQREAGAVFKGFDEAAVTFAPTYKFDAGTDTYDTSPKQRLPAWTDRVLFLSPDGLGVAALNYTSHPSIQFSDHKPVSALLKVVLCTGEDTLLRPAPMIPITRDAKPTSVGDAARGAVSNAKTAGGSLLRSLKSMSPFG